MPAADPRHDAELLHATLAAVDAATLRASEERPPALAAARRGRIEARRLEPFESPGVVLEHLASLPIEGGWMLRTGRVETGKPGPTLEGGAPLAGEWYSADGCCSWSLVHEGEDRWFLWSFEEDPSADGLILEEIQLLRPGFGGSARYRVYQAPTADGRLAPAARRLVTITPSSTPER